MDKQRIDAKFRAAVKAYDARHDRDPQRQIEIQKWCVDQLTAAGIKGATTELKLPGAYRKKNWDVGLMVDDQPQLAISCKSIVRNIPGTVPNRLDDMLGEAVNLHRAYPQAVIGYLILLADQDGRNDKNMDHWFERCGSRLQLVMPRASASKPAEQWESVCLLQMPLGRRLDWVKTHPGCDTLPAFFERLATKHKQRFS